MQKKGENMDVDKRLCEDIENIFKNGFDDENPRPKYEDGTPAHTISVNHVMRQYDLSNGEFPICTLRPIAWKSAIKEILWIYQDQSNSLEILRNKYNVHYWDAWESKDISGTIGVRYGETVRRHDLMNKLLNDIKTNPYGRRHIMSLWQEEDFKSSDGLMPCCYETIWNVRGEYLDMLMNQRSGDMLTASGAGGVNEVQYAALLLMVAKATGYKPGKFTHVVENEQIYDRHVDASAELLKRYNANNSDLTSTTNAMFMALFGCGKPMMKFNPKADDFYSFTIDDFQLIGYDPIKPQIPLELGI